MLPGLGLSRHGQIGKESERLSQGKRLVGMIVFEPWFAEETKSRHGGGIRRWTWSPIQGSFNLSLRSLVR
jgi:hypothetical protein